MTEHCLVIGKSPWPMPEIAGVCSVFAGSRLIEKLTNERDCENCAGAALHFRGAGASDTDHRTAGRVAHADGYLPGNPYSRDRRGLAIHRPAARPDVRAYHHAV